MEDCQDHGIAVQLQSMLLSAWVVADQIGEDWMVLVSFLHKCLNLTVHTLKGGSAHPWAHEGCCSLVSHVPSV